MLEKHEEIILYSLRLQNHGTMDRVLKTIYTFKKSNGRWPKFFEISNRCRAFASSQTTRGSVGFMTKEGYLDGFVFCTNSRIFITEKGYDRLRTLIKIHSGQEDE